MPIIEQLEVGLLGWGQMYGTYDFGIFVDREELVFYGNVDWGLDFFCPESEYAYE